MERGEKGSTPPWLQRTRTRAAGIKAREEQASEDRMRSFQEIDRIRIDQERKASQAQAKRDRTLYIMTFFFALVAIFAVILLALLLGS
jgi:hypothetical protein